MRHIFRLALMIVCIYAAVFVCAGSGLFVVVILGQNALGITTGVVTGLLLAIGTGVYFLNWYGNTETRNPPDDGVNSVRL